MTDTFKPEKTASAPKQPARPEAIRVRVLKFVGPTDVPGGAMPTTLTARDPSRTNQGGHDIEYQPWLRHHRVAWYEPTKKEPTRVVMIHESRVLSWEAA